MSVKNGGKMSKLAKLNIDRWCLPVGGILIILLIMKQFDIAILADYPSILGIVGLCLIALWGTTKF